MASQPFQDHLGVLLTDTTDQAPTSSVGPLATDPTNPCSICKTFDVQVLGRHLHIRAPGPLPVDLTVNVEVTSANGTRRFSPPAGAAANLAVRGIADWYLPVEPASGAAVDLILGVASRIQGKVRGRHG